jgi:hypothetical protein
MTFLVVYFVLFVVNGWLFFLWSFVTFVADEDCGTVLENRTTKGRAGSLAHCVKTGASANKRLINIGSKAVLVGKSLACAVGLVLIKD